MFSTMYRRVRWLLTVTQSSTVMPPGLSMNTRKPPPGVISKSTSSYPKPGSVFSSSKRTSMGIQFQKRKMGEEPPIPKCRDYKPLYDKRKLRSEAANQAHALHQ